MAAILPVPPMQPTTSIISVMEVHLREYQSLPHLPVFTTGNENDAFQRRLVPEVQYYVHGDESGKSESGKKIVCLGVTVDATPMCAQFDPRTKTCTNPSQQRVAVAITGVVSLLCPSTDMSRADVGNWVEIDTDNLPVPCMFRGYSNVEMFKYEFTEIPSKVINVDTSKVLIGRLLIKDPTNNIITIDLCPL